MTDFAPNTKVELLPGCDEVYRYAVAGSRGTIRKVKEDEFGFPLVYIEWDKTHWRYNNEPDGWTFASHFKTIEEDDPVAEQIAKAQKRRDDERCEHCGAEHSAEVREAEKYLDAVQSAMYSAVSSDGFLLITLTQEPLDALGFVGYVPAIYSASLSPGAAKALEEHALRLAAMAKRELENARRREER